MNFFWCLAVPDGAPAHVSDRERPSLPTVSLYTAPHDPKQNRASTPVQSSFSATRAFFTRENGEIASSKMYCRIVPGQDAHWGRSS